MLEEQSPARNPTPELRFASITEVAGARATAATAAAELRASSLTHGERQQQGSHEAKNPGSLAQHVFIPFRFCELLKTMLRADYRVFAMSGE